MKKFKILFIVFFIIAIIGLISFITGTRNVNLGAFIFPVILAMIFAILYIQKSRAR